VTKKHVFSWATIPTCYPYSTTESEPIKRPRFCIKVNPSDPKNFWLSRVKFSMSLNVAAVAECHKICPHQSQCWILQDRYDVMYLAGWRGSPPAVAVLADGIQCPVSLGEHVPSVIILPVSRLRGPTTLATASATECVSLGA